MPLLVKLCYTGCSNHSHNTPPKLQTMSCSFTYLLKYKHIFNTTSDNTRQQEIILFTTRFYEN